jgi:hypothetical protein
MAGNWEAQGATFTGCGKSECKREGPARLKVAPSPQAFAGQACFHYFLNKFSKACLASAGRAEIGVEVCFSTLTLIE